MTYTSLSVKEIAYTLGYEDTLISAGCLRKKTGIAPMEFPKNLK